MDKYITINEASTIYKKSISSIRRIVKELKESDLSKLEFEKLKNGSEKILISKNYLDRLFSKSKTSKSDSSSLTSSDDIVTFLKEQVLAKDELIKNLTQLLAMKEQQNQILLAASPKKKRWFGW
jgi:predicted HTH transcriptional regulator